MANERRKAAAMVAVAAMMVAERATAQDESAAAAPERKATIVLHVTNYAELADDVLDVAIARVAVIYKPVGVRLVWVEGPPSVRRHQEGQLHLNVLLLSRKMAEKQISASRIKGAVLGIAHPTSGRASIFCDRIATAPGAPKQLAIPLGDVIAHEVGHLVLGVNSHSRGGIMRAYTNVQAFHLESFDEAQERIIRAALVEPTVGTTR